MRVWLDDTKEMPEGYDLWVKDALAMAKLIEQGEVTHISFDHDLGSNMTTGYSVALFIEQLAYDGKLEPITWDVHTSNPVGRKRITQAMESAEHFWSWETEGDDISKETERLTKYADREGDDG